ncbi:MAG: Hsp20/alpha crystallin family protein [Desulfobacterales bacterium]|nr:Hsp20/alpha crystallin family protein [Desulfobacterales bacterium]
MIYRRFIGFPNWEFRSPFTELERMKRQMDRLMEGMAGPYQRPYAGVFPLINLTETKDSFFVRAELPGVVAGDLDIQATSNSISISGERKLPAENKDARWHRREREAGKFSRMIAMPSEIDPNQVDASLVSGILTVTVPKAEIAKPRQIAVR